MTDSAAFNPSIPAAKQRLHLLTVLRFCAAMWVLVFHLATRTGVPVSVHAWTIHFLNNGALAMTYFFVLSGAVLALGYGTLTLDPDRLVAYYRARFARIMPAYVALHLVALCWFTPGKEGPTTWLYTNLLSLAGLQAWFPHTFSFGANSGTWSVSVEFFLYALFPVGLLLLARGRARIGTGRLALALCLISAFCGLPELAFHGGTILYYTLPLLRLPEFLLGILVGLALADPPGRSSHPGLLALAAFTGAALAAVNPAHEYGLWTRANIVVVPAFAFLIFAFGRLEQRHGIDPRRGLWRVPVYLGEISYCLFLAHLVPMMFLDSDSGKTWKSAELARHGLTGVWGWATAASLCGAILLHHGVERPARRALFRWWNATLPRAKPARP